eukprot:5426409-Amphidinium_carterae.1
MACLCWARFPWPKPPAASLQGSIRDTRVPRLVSPILSTADDPGSTGKKNENRVRLRAVERQQVRRLAVCTINIRTLHITRIPQTSPDLSRNAVVEKAWKGHTLQNSTLCSHSLCASVHAVPSIGKW